MKSAPALAAALFLAAQASAGAEPGPLAAVLDGSGPPGEGPRLQLPDPPSGPAEAQAADAVPADEGSAGGGDSDWVLDRPEGPGPGPAPESPSAPERIRFWDRLQDKVFDDICKNIKLPLKYRLGLGDFGGVQVEGNRFMKRYPDRKLALIDHARMNVSLGFGHKLLEMAANLPLSVSVEARADGSAYVVRPLGGEKSCGELGRFLNILEFKTVVPVNARRLAGMQKGEIWRLPLTLRAGASIGAGTALSQVTISLSYGHAREELASATLHRIAEDALRLRLRFDRARIHGVSGGAGYAVPPAELGLDDAGNFFEKQADRLLAREVGRYLSAGLGLGFWRRDGRKALLEFVLDPNDPEQVERLSEFLRGNLDALALLMRVAHSAGSIAMRRGELAVHLDKLEHDYAAKLGIAPSYAGVDDYSHRGGGFNLRLPILYKYELSRGTEFDAIMARDQGAVVHIDRAWANSSHNLLDLPLLGQIAKSSAQRDVYVVTRVDGKGLPSSPMMVYLQQDGFVRHGEDSAREMVLSANGIMSLAGVRGSGRNTRALLPAAKLFPERPRPEPEPCPGDRGDCGPGSTPPLYRSAVSAFTLAFNQNAMLDILWASAEAVVRAFVNALAGREREAMDAALRHGAVRPDGLIDYDDREVRRELGASVFDSNEPGGYDIMAELRRLSASAARLVAGLVAARAGDWNQRGKALVRLVSGRDNGDLDYLDVMKVLVQLARPEDLYGEFIIHTNKKLKGEADVSARYLFHPENQTPEFGESLGLKERFSEPSLLAD